MSLDETIKAGTEAAEAVGNLGRATPTQFIQIMTLILLFCVVGLAGYEMTMGRPEMLKEIHSGQETGRQEFKAINEGNMQRFESIIDNQQRSHEKVVEMITGGKLKLSLSSTNDHGKGS